MSDPRFIFETVDFQNGANTINNFVNKYNAVNTSNPFQFRSDYDRMKNLLGGKGQSRNSGYYPGLYASIYNLTVTGSILPSTIGPGGGWGSKLWSGPISPVLINNSYLQSNAGKDSYVGVIISGYMYSASNTTVQFATTSDDGISVFFNGVNVINNWTYHGATTDTSATLTVNTGYNPISIYFFQGAVSAQCDFTYRLAGQPYTANLPCNFFYNYNQM